jgi:hypothetical protein
MRKNGLPCLVLAFVIAACDGATSPGDPQTLEATLEMLALEMNRSGDSDAAAGYSGAAMAVRLGAAPGTITVSVNGESVQYRALVTAAAHQLRGGEVVLRRSLVAWTGQPRPEAMLQVTTMSDNGLFSWPSVATPIDTRTRALGIWADLVARQRWVATAGSAAIILASQGPSCPHQPQEPMLRCILASFDLDISGTFHKVSTARVVDQSEAMAIATAAEGVPGVVLARINP